jgi:hypothetical protein
MIDRVIPGTQVIRFKRQLHYLNLRTSWAISSSVTPVIRAIRYLKQWDEFAHQWSGSRQLIGRLRRTTMLVAR